MEYAARLTKVPSVVTPLVTLLVGAAIATGAYALIDDSSTATATKTIVVEQPGPNAADIPGKNESATAAAVSGSSAVIPGHDESDTASAISQSSGVELRGSKASASAEPTDPHAPAVSLRNP
jgi:hypothetical protein